MGQAKNRGTREQRIQQAKERYVQGANQCTMYIRGTYQGRTIFAVCAESMIPDTVTEEFGSQKWEKIRDKMIGKLAFRQLYELEGEQKAIAIVNHVSEYLQTSATLWTKRNHPEIAKSFGNTQGYTHQIDLDDLGCVFEYDLKDHISGGLEIGTQGPKWMSKSDVFKYGDSINQKNGIIPVYNSETVQ